mmetsp:Transcript_10618/g.17397  ORF Transcript_10618/g.17397 Transcript_10618/m.17397 type:complete len:119 (-) Transcript_10618:238-594(-)
MQACSRTQRLLARGNSGYGLKRTFINANVLSGSGPQAELFQEQLKTVALCLQWTFSVGSDIVNPIMNAVSLQEERKAVSWRDLLPVVDYKGLSDLRMQFSAIPRARSHGKLAVSNDIE